MNDCIEIRDLRVSAIIGTRPEERIQEQEIVFNLVIRTDFAAAAASDDLGDTVNYVEIAEQVRSIARTSKCLLMERLAVLAAEAVLSFDRVEAVELAISKAAALPSARCCAVRIFRSRKGGEL